MPKRPNRQVCQLCGSDEEVTVSSEGPDMWVFTCTARNQHDEADHRRAWFEGALSALVNALPLAERHPVDTSS